MVHKERKGNKYCFQEDYVIGFTSNKNSKFYIDREDYEKVKQYTWSMDANGYIYTTINRKYTKLHRFLFDCNDLTIIDHINRKKVRQQKRKFEKSLKARK